MRAARPNASGIGRSALLKLHTHIERRVCRNVRRRVTPFWRTLTVATGLMALFVQAPQGEAAASVALTTPPVAQDGKPLTAGDAKLLCAPHSSFSCNSTLSSSAVLQPTTLAMAATAAPSWCTSEWLVDRTESCLRQSSFWQTIDQNGVINGQLDFVITNYVKTDPKSLTVTDSFSIQVTDGWGAALNPLFTYRPSCDGTCTASTDFFNATRLSVGSTYLGDDTFVDTTTTLHHYEPTFSVGFTPSGGITPAVGTYNAPDVRCDDEIGSLAGCVNPAGQPVMNMSSLPTIAPNIRVIQQAPLHLGDPNFTNPLTKDTAAQDSNRAAACPPAAPMPTDGTTYTCDEYPFASTQEGAAQTPPPNSGSWWAPKGEQDSQGGIVASFNQAERVLEGDKFYVQV